MPKHPRAKVRRNGCTTVCLPELHKEQLPPGVPGGRNAETVQVPDLLLPRSPRHLYQEVSPRIQRGKGRNLQRSKAAVYC